MKKKKIRPAFDARQLPLPLDYRVRPEPALRPLTVGKTAAELWAQGEMFLSWGRQLQMLARIWDADSARAHEAPLAPLLQFPPQNSARKAA